MNNVRVRLPRKLAKSVSSGVLAEAGRLNPVGALSITLNMLPLHRVSMTISEKDLSLSMHDLVEVYNHKGSVGIYRVTKITNTYRKNRKIDLSHGLDVFSDSTFDMIEEYKGTVDGMLAKIIAAQTQKIGGVKYWQLGTCADHNPWNKDIKYDNLMECLTEIASKEEDYMFTFDQSTFPWTLNFVARDSTVLSEFRLGRNTENCVVTEDDSDLCTRLYLSVTSETNDEEGAGTYINEGYFTYNDSTAQSDFGIVCKTAGVDQEDFASQAALEAWVNAYFGRHNKPGIQITIDGIELNKLTGESIDESHLSRICRVALPDYSTTFNERIISVNYPDALRQPMHVRNSLANKRQTSEDAFSEIRKTASSASSAAGGAGRSAHNDATYFRRTIGDTANGLYSRIEQTAYYIRAEVVDVANGLYSRIEQTASYIRAEVADTANGLNSKIEQTASYIRSEVANTANGLNSKIEQTASYIRSEVSNTANGLNSKIDQTASYIRSEVSNTANGLNSKIDQTASYIRSEVSQTANGLRSEIEQTASAVALKVSKGDVATQLSVECGNVSVSGGNLNVDGMVTANSVQSAIAQISALSVVGLNASGTIKSTSGVQAPDFNLTGGGALSNAIQTISDGVASGGTVSFSIMRFSGTTGSFSFNIASTQYYQDGVAAALAQGKAASLKDAVLGAKVQGQKWYVNITKADDSTQLLEVNLASAYADARNGYTLGTFTPATVTTQGTGVSIQEIGTAVYFKSESITPVGTKYSAVTNTVTVQGTGVSIQAIGTAVYFKSANITPVGTKYTAVTNTVTVQGTGVSIQAIGTAVYFKSASITPIGTAYTVTTRTRNLRGTSHTALTGYSTYNSGSAITLYRRSTNAYGDVSYSSAGYYVWRYGGSTSTLYEAGSTVTDYDVGSGAAGKTLYEAGTAVTRYEKLSSSSGATNTYYNAKTAQDYYQAGTSRTFYTYNSNGNGDLYAAGTAVTRYEKLNSSSGATNIYYNAKNAQDYYQAGSSRTFYTYNNNGNGDLYAAGTAVTRYEKLNAGGSGINTYYNAKTAQDYYQRGQTITDVYYTKAS